MRLRVLDPQRSSRQEARALRGSRRRPSTKNTMRYEPQLLSLIGGSAKRLSVTDGGHRQFGDKRIMLLSGDGGELFLFRNLELWHLRIELGHRFLSVESNQTGFFSKSTRTSSSSVGSNRYARNSWKGIDGGRQSRTKNLSSGAVRRLVEIGPAVKGKNEVARSVCYSDCVACFFCRFRRACG